MGTRIEVDRFTREEIMKRIAWIPGAFDLKPVATEAK